MHTKDIKGKDPYCQMYYSFYMELTNEVKKIFKEVIICYFSQIYSEIKEVVDLAGFMYVSQQVDK